MPDSIYDRIKVTQRRWLITGGLGFIGSRIAKTLLKLNQHVVIIDNAHSSYHDIFTDEEARKIEMWCKDIRYPRACFDVCENIDYILHHAALCSVPDSVLNPIDTHDNNVTGFLNILIAARKCGVKRVVYASSASVYGDLGNQIANECIKPNPASPYAASKVINEVYAKVFSSNNIQVAHVDTVGLRYFNVYGPGQLPKGRYSSVIPQWIKELRMKGTVHIFGNGESTRDFVFISDVVRANLMAALATSEDIPISGEVFNVASGESVTLLHLYGTILQTLGLQGKAFNPVIDAALRPGDIVQSHGSPAKIRNAMGWEPRVKLDVGISNVVASLE